MDFTSQVRLFTEGLEGLLVEAKMAAASDFDSDHKNWEQTERSFVETIRGMEQEISALRSERDAAKSALYDLKDRLSGLV